MSGANDFDNSINKKIVEKFMQKEAERDRIKISAQDFAELGSREKILETYRSIKSYNEMLKTRMTFINKDVTSVIPFTKENLYLICGYSGNGKCLAIDTPILMHNFSVKKVQDVVVGDRLMGPDGKARIVGSLARGMEEMFDIIPIRGGKYTVNGSHILSLKWVSNRVKYKGYKKGDTINISVYDYIGESDKFKFATRGWKSDVISNRDNPKVTTVKIEVRPVGVGNYYGFELFGGVDKLFLLGDCTVTHNTSLSANIAYPLWQQGKKILWISNEEATQDILFRIACLHLGYNFNDYKKGFMSMDKQVQVLQLFPEICKYVHVFDVNYNEGVTTKIEGVKNILEEAKNQGYSCVLMDYYQLIKFSIDAADKKNTFQILDDFRIYLMRYIKRCDTAVVLFAQLHSIGKRNNKALDSRIKDCPTIYEAATVVMEIIPDFENSTTDIVIHKDRFGLAGNRVVVGFDRGKFIPVTEEFKKRVRDNRIEKIQQEIVKRKEGGE